VAAHLRGQGIEAGADQVLITTGSQQGLDLVAKVLVDAGAPVAVETPTYLGALQAFSPCEPTFVSLAGDAEGPLPEALARCVTTRRAAASFMCCPISRTRPGG
jgi:2-aminoadipate transaminase